MLSQSCAFWLLSMSLGFVVCFTFVLSSVLSLGTYLVSSQPIFSLFICLVFLTLPLLSLYLSPPQDSSLPSPLLSAEITGRPPAHPSMGLFFKVSLTGQQTDLYPFPLGNMALSSGPSVVKRV